ncbi:MAG: hypothetical protein QNJ11_08840 [Woeseiaceae bacterium]|nr:hypothetical protein [Woeseiaceae bacterium]
MRRAKASAPPDASVAFHAPLFDDLVSGLHSTERNVVLDLGAASTDMLALLGRSRCRVDIADFAYSGGIDKLNASAAVSAADALLPNPLPGDDFNLVFCWDLPNYLTLDALAALMTAIGHRARPRALVHALIVYAEREMHEVPGRFVPTVGGELIDRNARGPSIEAPRYSPEDLGKNMGGFVLDRARLLSNGMQEFVFQLQCHGDSHPGGGYG